MLQIVRIRLDGLLPPMCEEEERSPPPEMKEE